LLLNCVGFTNTETKHTSLSSTARRTSEACPACRAPMVGTRPMVLPDSLQAFTTAFKSSFVVIICIFLSNIGSFCQKNVQSYDFFCIYQNFFVILQWENVHTIMKEPKRILFVSQEISPYLAEETPIRLLNRQLPEYFQSHGYETRTFMPKFGEINERRNQLHEVIRLSGMNLIIEDSDHPLLIKVASIQSARIQIYFIDNDDLFHRRKGVMDEHGVEYADNDDRVIFFARGVIETVKKLRWTPDIIVCSGWMSALTPLYLKRAFNDEPFFSRSRIVLSLNDNEYQKPFPTNFTDKLRINGISNTDVRSIAGFPVGYEELMRLAIDFSDAIVYSTPQVNQRLMNYAETKGKPILPYQATENVSDTCARQWEFYQTLLDSNE